MAVTVLFAAALKQDSLSRKRLSRFKLGQDIVIIPNGCHSSVAAAQDIAAIPKRLSRVIPCHSLGWDRNYSKWLS
jgi:hypothetical protein